MPESVQRLDLAIGIETVINRVQVTVYPVETVGSLQTIWQARTTLRIAPGQTRVIYALFRTDEGERCGAVDVAAPVATTDYRVFEDADGTGVEYTSDPAFSISTVTEATRMKITLGNSATGPLYVTLLKVRGKPLLVHDPITVEKEDTTSQTSYEKRALALDLKMQPDPTFAQTYAEYVIGRFAEPVLGAERVMIRNRATLNGKSIFGVGLMDKVMVTDAHTGLDHKAHWVTGVEYDIRGGKWDTTLHLERTEIPAYWLLGKQGYSELDNTTRLGF